MAKKRIWVILILVSISLIIAGTVLVLVKKDKDGEIITATKAKTTSAKPKEEVWDWTFEWEAAAEHLASDRQKIVGRINDAQIISRNDNVLKFRYKKNRAGKL